MNDTDLAENNMVVNNRIRNLSPERMIIDYGNGNLITSNLTSSNAPQTPANCFVPNGFPKANLVHGQQSSMKLFGEDKSPVVANNVSACADGELIKIKNTLELKNDFTIKSVESNNSGSNSGASYKVECPGGQKVAALKVACSLEGAYFPFQEIVDTKWGMMNIVRASDNISSGLYWAGESRMSQGVSSTLKYPAGADSITVGCREHDQNGGDCQVRAQVICA